MTINEKAKLIRWLLLDAEDINEHFKMDEYKFYVDKNEIGVIFKWRNGNQYQQKKSCEYSEETNSPVNIAEQQEQTLKSTM